MALRKLRLLTSGESHGSAVTAILEGIPAHLVVSREKLQQQMNRRKLGYGRGGRMKIETDEVEITGGLRFGKTLGSPLTFVVHNRDYPNWSDTMSVWAQPQEVKHVVYRPRPGHADLAGGLKYNEHDLRNILERASARETVMRCAAGFLCAQLLELFGIRIASHVISIGSVQASRKNPSWEEVLTVQENDRLRCVDPVSEEKMMTVVDEGKIRKETLGGVFEVIAHGVPPGLGSHVQWDQKLDGRIAQALMSIPAVKGVVIGNAFEIAKAWGSEAHDEIFYDSTKGFYRKTNRAGGIEGGITNGEEIRVLVAMKPLSTLMKPLQSVDVHSKQPEEAVVERSDICAVPAAAVVGEAMMALILTDAFLEKFGGDCVEDLQATFAAYLQRLASY